MTADRRDETVEHFLSEAAADLDAAARPVGADEALVRAAAGSAARRPRWRPLPRATAGVPRMALAFGVTLGLLVGVVAGFVAGRSAADDDRQSVTAGNDGGDDAGENAMATTTMVDGFASGGLSRDTGQAVSERYRRLFVRVADAIVIRAYVVDPLDVPDNERCGELPEGEGNRDRSAPWCPPAACYAGQQLIGELNNENAVGQTWTGAVPSQERLAVEGPASYGVAEDDPFVVWSVRAAPDVADVRLRSGDAVVDGMVPVEGWALLVRPGAEWSGIVEALAEDGSVTASHELREYQSFRQPDECIPPPPPLPDAQGDPPADVDAAEAAIRAAFVTAFSRAAVADRAAAVEEGDELFDAASDNEVGTATVDVGEIRFINDREAAMHVSFVDESSGTWIAYARVVDGSWKVAVQTACEMLWWADEPCSSLVEEQRGAEPSTTIARPGG